MRNLAVPIVALALAGGVAACGDDEEDSGETGDDDFVTQLDAICIEGAEAAREVNLELGYANEAEDLIERSELLLDARKVALTDLVALGSPAELADAYDAYLAARQDVVTATQAEIAALEDEDTAALEAADAALAEGVQAMEAAGGELGAEACAGVLPDDDAQAAEDVVREYSTTTDAAVICEPGGIATEGFVEDGFGSVNACLDHQHKLASEPGSVPENIEVNNVSGVDDVAATIEYDEIGGGPEKTALVAQLFYVDGEWKLFSVFEG